ncbi:hypothetical protein GQ42DRAFT_155568 [Ramicandelaber brevisporus]|nr:hypothetical protein GQ42DRAFT_155568 [Ramicandelaber brevisporus]
MRFRDAVYIPVEDREHSNAVSVDTDHNEPVDNGDSTATGTESISTEDTPTSTRVPLPSEYSDILVETIRLVTTELESPESEIRTLRGRFKESYGRRSYSPLSIERIHFAS